MNAQRTTNPRMTRERLAELIEQHGEEVLSIVAHALREDPDPSLKPAAGGAHMKARAIDLAAVDETTSEWRQVDVIEGFSHSWPEVHEHYGPMTVWERSVDDETVRLAIGQPRERLDLYGKERGWVSVWEVANGQPREQCANFIETDDFETTGERIALIRGKGGNRQAGFEPGDEDLLSETYRGVRIAVQRDRIVGPYAKKRLGVIATDDDTVVMLEHALVHRQLRTE